VSASFFRAANSGRSNAGPPACPFAAVPPFGGNTKEDFAMSQPSSRAALFDGTQNVRQQFLSAIDGFVAAKAGNLEMIILKYVDLNSFPDQSHVQSHRIRSRSFDIEMHTSFF
jgi:hypothetical protein